MRLLSSLAPLLAVVLARPAAQPTKPPPPLAPLPMLPSIGRVKIAHRGAAILVVEEVTLPRGDWADVPLDFHVAFGAPGAPTAIDAHLVPIADGALEAEDAEVGEAQPFDRVPRRPAAAYPLLGRERMAGIVVHLSRDALASAFAPGGMAALRIRSALELPAPDHEGGRSVLVRLGASAEGTPFTLGRVVIGAPGARAEARLCGPEADGRHLALSPRAARTQSPERPIAPVLVPRHASDDLCVRLWP